MKRLVILTALALLPAAVVRPVAAQESVAPGAVAPRPSAPQPAVSRGLSAADSLLEARTREVAAQLRCPVCQGLSLADSPSELSQEMKDLVREQLRSGKTPDEVRSYFIQRYGEWILLEPQAHGFNWVVYALPVFLLVGGAGALTVALRRWTSRAPVGRSPEPLEDEEPASDAVV